MKEYLRHKDILDVQRPERIAIGATTVVVACFSDPGVVVLDSRNLSVRQRIALDWQAERPGVLPARCLAGDLVLAGDIAFVAQVFSEVVVVLNVETGAVLARLPLGGEGYFAASPDRRTVYFASNRREEFSIIDVQSLAHETLPYPPGSRGIGAVLAHPDGQRLFLGLQRGAKRNDRVLAGGNSHLAVFDLRARAYLTQVYLAEVIGPEQSDDSTPHSLTLSPDGMSLYVGMFQSRQGILVVDLESYEVLRGIRFSRSGGNRGIFEWVDPLAQVIYGDLLLTVNRNNYELAIVGRRDEEILARVPLSGNGNGPSTIALAGDRALIGHHEQAGLLVVDLLGLVTSLREAGQQEISGGSEPQEVTVENIEEFKECRSGSQPTASEWTTVMRQLPERKVKEHLCDILGDVPKSDWGGETADHYTSALHIAGKRLTGAFVLKGPADFRPMTLDMLGKRADQIQRLASTEAKVLVVQHAHEITEQVRKELRVWAREGSEPRYYCLIDGKDTYRLLRAYGKL